MRKNLKTCVERVEVGEAYTLIDWNRYDVIGRTGMQPDFKHARSAHVCASWRYADRTRVRIPLDGTDLSSYRYMTFSAFSVKGAGGSFYLMLDTSEEGSGHDGYAITLPITKDGWNEYRIELPFLHAVRRPSGFGSIKQILLDCAVGGQSNSTETVLYLDNLTVWQGMAPPLYASMPELKGAAAFAKSGRFAIVNRSRIATTIDGSDAKPFEQNGILWIPMAPVAAGIAYSAVVDNLAGTLSFTYRRKKYVFSAGSNRMTVNGVSEHLGFIPGNINGTLYFPAEFVRNFFHWRQLYQHPLGLIVFSNRRAIFDGVKDEATVWQLVADMTFERPTGQTVLDDLHRRFPNPLRGRLLLSHDELMQLRKLAKTDATLGGDLDALKAQYGVGSEAYGRSFAEAYAGAPEKAMADAADALIAFALLFRLTGDKKYGERAAEEAEAVAGLERFTVGSVRTFGDLTLGLAIAYDWCHHAWSEARKATVERGILRNAMRPGLEIYDGKGQMWQTGGSAGAIANAGLCAAALALADVYPETALRLLDRILRNAEPCFAPYAPDGGYPQGVSAWECATRGLALLSAMLQRACGSDYGLSSAPGFAATAYFPIMTEGAGGYWNFHSVSAGFADTSILPWFRLRTGDGVPAWMRRQQILAGKKTVHPFDLLFYTPEEEGDAPYLPLDAVYRKAGLAVMRSDWSADAMTVGLHGGRNNISGGELDAGCVILDCAGERFFSETGGIEALPAILRRRAEGQNTLTVDPPASPAPDQNPDAEARLLMAKGSPDRAFAVVDMSETNDRILRGKRGVLLLENRSVAVIQDELVLDGEGDVVWSAWTEAEVLLNKSGRMAKLTRNGKTLVCRLCGVGSPARFTAETYPESGFTRLTVRVSVKERLRMAVVCRMLAEGETGSEKHYDVVPMSRWEE